MRLRNLFNGILGKNENANSFDVTTKPEATSSDEQQISSFRRYLPQIFASSAKNLLVVDFGLSSAFPTILIPALTGLNSALNPDETLSLTHDQATWLASITAICQPIGSIASGFLTEPLGRKYALMFVNIPFLISWILLYFAESVGLIYTAFGMLGIAIGLMEAPVYVYIGEICEPKIRGMITASAGIAATFGIWLVYFMGTQTTWRNAALSCAIVPLLGIFLISFCPETPHWLLTRNRKEDAMKSLQWLRGWVDASAVQHEFQAVQRCQIRAQICYTCEKQNEMCHHPPPTIRNKIADLFRLRVLRPFILLGSMYFLSVFCGFHAYRPYIVQVLYFYRSPVDPNQVVVWMGYIGVATNFLLMICIRPIGKRDIYLWTLAVIVLITFSLGIYGFAYLPLDKTSFDLNRNSTESNAFTHYPTETMSYFPLVAFIVLHFVGCLGVSAIPHMMMCEVFPFKSKAYATGLTVIVSPLSSFISSKSFYFLETSISLPGLSVFYGCIGFVGFVAMFCTLPETEGRSLEEIENYFADHKRKFNDITIPYRDSS